MEMIVVLWSGLLAATFGFFLWKGMGIRGHGMFPENLFDEDEPLHIYIPIASCFIIGLFIYSLIWVFQR